MRILKRCRELVAPMRRQLEHDAGSSTDHRYVQLHHIVDLFVMKRLSRVEVREFLRHRATCAESQEDHRLQEVFVTLMKEELNRFTR